MAADKTYTIDEIVEHIYLGLLDRKPDEKGFEHYKNRLLKDRESLKNIIKEIKCSNESINKLQALPFFDRFVAYAKENKTEISIDILNNIRVLFKNSGMGMFSILINLLFLLGKEKLSSKAIFHNKLNISFVYLEKKEKDSLIDIYTALKEKYRDNNIYDIQIIPLNKFFIKQLSNTYLYNLYIVSGFDILQLISIVKPENSTVILFDHGVSSLKKITYKDYVLNCCDYYFTTGEIRKQRTVQICPELENRVFVVGFPKLKHFTPTKNEKIEYCKKMNLDPKKPIILFAPTWTSEDIPNNENKGIWKIKKLKTIPNLFAILHSGNINMCVELINRGYKIHILQDNETISDHYPFVDILITDISSTAVEFARIGKPVICILEEDNIYSGFDSQWISPSGIPIIPHTNYEWKICKVCKTEEVETAIEEILSNKYEINTELVNLLCDCYGDEAVHKSLNYLIPIIEDLTPKKRSEIQKEKSFPSDEIIRNIYLGLLNREPDEGGLNAYRKALLNGVKISDIIKSIKNSQEFFMKQHDSAHHMLYGGHISYAYENPATVFIHIPKTAGQSLHWLFKQKVGENKVSPLFNNLYTLPVNFAYSYDVIFGHTDYEAVKLIVQRKEVKLITFLRDPVKRLISLYKFWWSHDPEFHKGNTAVDLANKYTIEEFFKAEEVKRILWNDMFGRFMGYKFKDTVKDALNSIDESKKQFFIHEKILPLIKEKIEEEYFFIGLQEQFNEDVCKMFKKLGFECSNEDIQNAKVNITDNNVGKPGFKKEKPSFEITEGVLNSIKELTELDLVLYNAVKQHRQEKEKKGFAKLFGRKIA